jgi:hypothetical protein
MNFQLLNLMKTKQKVYWHSFYSTIKGVKANKLEKKLSKMVIIRYAPSRLLHVQNS